MQYITVLSLEVLTESRGDLKPDPEFDAILSLFFHVHNDVPLESGKTTFTGALIVDPSSSVLQEPGILVPTSSSHQLIPLKQRKDKQRTPIKTASNRGERASPKPSTSQESGGTASGLATQPGARRKPLLLEQSGVSGLNVVYVKDENQLLEKFVELIHRYVDKHFFRHSLFEIRFHCIFSFQLFSSQYNKVWL